MPNEYVHGYSGREAQRLQDQAVTLAELLHHDSIFPRGSSVLEVGCGTGEQTVILAGKNPDVHFTSIDISADSLDRAKDNIKRHGITNVTFRQGDIFDLPFPGESFDHVFVCFVLEHLLNPIDALLKLKRILKKSGSLTVIEGDHGSWYAYPPSGYAQKAVDCLIHAQAKMGGNALIGRELYPLLVNAGIRDVVVFPRMVYVDGSRPNLIEGFSKSTFIAMVEAVHEQASFSD